MFELYGPSELDLCRISLHLARSIIDLLLRTHTVVSYTVNVNRLYSAYSLIIYYY